jgi:hypothetical protein
MKRAILLIVCVIYVYSLLEHTGVKPNSWQSQYGAARRKIDHKLIADLERKIAAEDRIKPSEIPMVDNADAIDFLDAERKRIARAFGRPIK